jgi:hypothetical protein
MDAEQKVQPIAGDKPDSGGRSQSTIEFPYMDLDSAVEAAEAVHKIGGSSCDWDQLAASLSLSALGGGFRLKMIGARTFGVVGYDRGKVNLTALGLRVVDPQQAKAAKAEAFLSVQLYRAIYEKFKGNSLPPQAGLEREMVNLGVAPKQSDKARQVFQRSAKQAGFFEFGIDRLVMPPLNGAPQPAATSAPAPEKAPVLAAGGGGGDDLHPFIKGLLQKLPEPESEWPVEQRAKWLTTAMNIFDLMYTTPANADTKFVTIEVKSV